MRTSLDKGLGLLSAILLDRGYSKLSRVANGEGLPQSTARRMAVAFQKHGLLVRAERGRYVVGATLYDLVRSQDSQEVLRRIARSCLRRLSRKLQVTGHLGVLENNMVTYAIKERGGGAHIFSKEGTQLEAYCSGIGKVLLAQLSKAKLNEYINAGEFVSLTNNTITGKRLLREELARVKIGGFAVDNAETCDNIYCVAVPVYLNNYLPIQAGISITVDHRLSAQSLKAYRAALDACAASIVARLRESPRE